MAWAQCYDISLTLNHIVGYPTSLQSQKGL